MCSIWSCRRTGCRSPRSSRRSPRPACRATAIAGLGILLTLILGEFDLSVAANLSLANVFVVTLPERQGVPVWLSIVIAVAISAGVGLVNGLVVVLLQVNAFVATLGMATALGGMSQLYLGGTDQYVAPSSLTALTRTEWLRLPLSVFYALAIAVVLHTVLQYTAVGRRMNAVGGNVRAARLAGIPADRYRVAAFTAGGLLAGIAGVVLGATLGAATSAGNPALLLPIFAAALLGSTTITPGRFNVPGLLVAALFLAAAVSGLQQMGVAAWIQPAFNGTALVVAVALSGWASRARSHTHDGDNSKRSPPRGRRPPPEPESGRAGAQSRPRPRISSH